LVLLESSTKTYQENVDQLKKDLNLSQEEWAEWQKIFQSKEDDQLVLEKYSRDDARRISDLSIRIQKLREEYTKKTQQLSQKMVDEQLINIDIEKTAENFKKLLLERHQIMEQWEACLNRIKAKDEEIQELRNGNDQLYHTITEKRVVAQQHSNLLEELNGSINALEKMVDETEKTLAKLRVVNKNGKDENALIQSDLDSLRLILKRSKFINILMI
jgi:chromosome segregation ATPase